MGFFNDINQVHQGITLTERQINMKIGYDFGMKYKWYILLFTIYLVVFLFSIWYFQAPGELLQVGVI